MEMTFKQTEELYRVLQGELPEGFKFPPIKLSPDGAGIVIWLLQERYRVIPDNYEQCFSCKDLYDSHSGGIFTKDGPVCECCMDMYDLCPLCEENFKKSESPETTFFVLSAYGAKDQDMQPGLYKVNNFPVYISNMFSQWIYKHNVELVKKTQEYEEIGFICHECFTKLETLHSERRCSLSF